MNGYFSRLRFGDNITVLILIALTACASPEPIVTTMPVTMPLDSPCKAAMPERPVWPVVALERGATLFELVRAALSEIEARRAYEIELEAAVRACR